MTGQRKYWLTAAAVLAIASALRISSLPIGKDTVSPSPRQNGYYDYRGTAHIHTRYSEDAQGTYEEIAKVATEQNIHFLLGTEHNNLDALKDGKEGWHGDTLVLIGTEISVNEGYLFAFDVNEYTFGKYDIYKFVHPKIEAQNGFSMIAHTQSKRWRWRKAIPDSVIGQEVLDLADQFVTASPLAIISAIMYIPFNKQAAHLQVYRRPSRTLEIWDKIAQERDYVGIYGADLHQSVKILFLNLRFPSAEWTLPFANNHIILSEAFTKDLAHDKPLLYDAIKKGHLYIGIDLLQDTTGFFFSARQGVKDAWMGETLPAGPTTDFFVTLPPQHTSLDNVIIYVYHNGKQIAESADPAFRFKAHEPGAYRVVVETRIPTFWGRGRNVAWIYSNPIYLR